MPQVDQERIRSLQQFTDPVSQIQRNVSQQQFVEEAYRSKGNTVESHMQRIRALQNNGTAVDPNLNPPRPEAQLYRSTMLGQEPRHFSDAPYVPKYQEYQKFGYQYQPKFADYADRPPRQLLSPRVQGQQIPPEQLVPGKEQRVPYPQHIPAEEIERAQRARPLERYAGEERAQGEELRASYPRQIPAEEMDRYQAYRLQQERQQQLARSPNVARQPPQVNSFSQIPVSKTIQYDEQMYVPRKYIDSSQQSYENTDMKFQKYYRQYAPIMGAPSSQQEVDGAYRARAGFQPPNYYPPQEYPARQQFDYRSGEKPLRPANKYDQEIPTSLITSQTKAARSPNPEKRQPANV